MISYSYTRSDDLAHALKKIESARSLLLSLIISREEEIRFQWEALILRVYFIPALYDLSVRKSVVFKTLVEDRDPTHFLFRLRNAIQWIRENWYVSNQPITAFDINQLYSLVWKSKSVIATHELDEHLSYIQSTHEHPVVQALIAQAVIYNLKPFKAYNDQCSHLVFLLFLNKYGYTFRDMVVIEDYFFHERIYFKDLLAESFTNHDVTVWIEYGIQALLKAITTSVNNIREKNFTIPLPKLFFELSTRQKKVLTFLNQPGKTITNKEVQKMFKISPITASRELNRLTTLRFIIPQGRGRAISYRLA